MNTKLVIFDWAGTLVDFGSCAPLAAFREAFANNGLPISDAVARRPMGAHKRDHVREILGYSEIATRVRADLAREPDESVAEEIYAEFTRLLPGYLRRHAAPVPGALETIAWLRARAIPVGGTTGYTRAMMDVLEPVAGLAGLSVDALICADEVSRCRPAPWACLRLAERFGAFPVGQCLKVGDTAADMAEGVNAGMIPIGISETGNEFGLDAAALCALPPDERLRLRTAAEERLRSAGAWAVLAGVHELPAWIEENLN